MSDIKANLKKILCAIITVAIIFSSVIFNPFEVMAAPMNLAAGLSYEHTVFTPTQEDYTYQKWEDTDNKELTDGIYDCSFDYSNAAWTGVNGWFKPKYTIETVQTIIFDLASEQNFQTITANFLVDSKNGIGGPKNAVISISADKTEWATIYERKDIVIAVNNPGCYKFSFAAADALKARYIKLEFTHSNAWLGMDEIEILAPDPTAIINLAANLPYEFKAFDPLHPDYIFSGWEDTGNKELTDGAYDPTGEFSNSEWTGVNGWGGSTQQIISFDLGEEKAISRIEANFIINPGSGIEGPGGAVIKVSTDKSKWTEIVNQSSIPIPTDKKTYKYSFSASKAFKARYVTIEFRHTNSWMGMDEIEILGSNDTTGAVDPSQIVNGGLKKLSENMPYVRSETDTTYPDTGDCELTDGIYGSTSFQDPAWSGFYFNFPPEKTVTFDLGTEKAINNISANFLVANSVGITLPSKLEFRVSLDGEKWFAVYQKASSDTKLQTFKYEFARNTPVKARYVQLYVFSVGSWSFIDEIEIWGSDDISGAIEPDDPTFQTGYMKPSLEATGGIHDLLLAYNQYYENGTGDWTVEKLRPYLTYLDRDGNALDTMFDGILFLALNSNRQNFELEGAPRWYSFDTGRETATAIPSEKKDWDWYIEKTFKTGGDMDELNKAAQIAANEVNNPNYKAKVVVMVPYPARIHEKFGDIDGDGINDVFTNNMENRKKAVKWFIDSVISKMNEGNYEYLDFTGLYWLSESTSGNEAELVKYFNQLTHEANLKSFWIPFYTADGVASWKDLGFDAVAYQPNHFFDGSAASRIGAAASKAQEYRMGIEIEGGPSVMDSIEDYNLYMNYLDGAVEYGFQGPDVFRAYYQWVTGYMQLAKSDLDRGRRAYEDTYKMLKGTLKVSNRAVVDMSTLMDKSTNQVILKPLKDHEYSMDLVKWTDSNIFTGLKPGTAYNFYQRIKGTVTKEPSIASEAVTIITVESSCTGETVYVEKSSPNVKAEVWHMLPNGNYMFLLNGIPVTGWKLLSDKWCFFNEDATLKHAWGKSGGEWKCYILKQGNWEVIANTDLTEFEKLQNTIELKDRVWISDSANLNYEQIQTQLKKEDKIAFVTKQGTIEIPKRTFEMLGLKQGEVLTAKIRSSLLPKTDRSQGYYDVTLYIGGKAITDHGRVLLRLPYSEGNSALIAYHVDDTKGRIKEAISIYSDGEVKILTDKTGIISLSSDTMDFKDIPTDYWAVDGILFAKSHGLFSGTGNNHFDPDGIMTRGMLVSVLGRMLGVDTDVDKDEIQSAFTDVSDKSYYASYVAWAAKNDIIKGVGGNKFAPDAAVTREQMMVVLNNVLHLLERNIPETTETKFTDDIKISNWAKDAVEKMSRAGIINSRSGEIREPQGAATRAEIADILMLFVEGILK